MASLRPRRPAEHVPVGDPPLVRLISGEDIGPRPAPDSATDASHVSEEEEDDALKRTRSSPDPTTEASHISEENLTLKSDPPVDKFPSVTTEDIWFNPVGDMLRPFIGLLHSRLIDHAQYGKILDSSLLPYQTTSGKQPPKWFRIHLLGSGDDKVIIYVRSDNFYFIAFENKHGLRFQLAPDGATEMARLIPDATFISCGGDYPSLMNYKRPEEGIGRTLTLERLLVLLLVKETFIEDVGVLSNYYHPPPADATERFQKALTRICFIICEFSRNFKIFEHVDGGWHFGVRLAVLLVYYMWKWKDMSQALRAWLTDKSRELTEDLKAEILMNCPEEVTKVLCLVLNAQGPGIVVKSASDPSDDKNGRDHDDDKKGRDQDDDKKGCDQDGLPGLSLAWPNLGKLPNSPCRLPNPSREKHTAGSSQPAVCSLMRGQPLVEVFRVSANFPFVGNISVFDTRWGMTICQCDDWNKSSSDFEARRRLWVLNGNAATEFKDNLVLTGPSRVITAASGGFVIKADVPRRGRKAREITQFEWNCSDSPIYNEPQICTITTRRGILFVTYAVLNDALEGFLRVRLQLSNDLLLGEGPRVFGTIRAQVDKHENTSVLFCKGIEEAVQLSFRGGSISLPLSRSIVSVPFGANLHITGKLEFVGRGISTGIDHFIQAEEEEVHTEWVEHGTWSSAVQLWLSPRL